MSKYSSQIKTILCIIVGNAILALGVSAFVLPDNLIMGGGTGIAITLNHYFNVDIAIAIGAINIIMFLIGVFFLGKNFAFKTIISTIVYPMFIGIFSRVTLFGHLTSDTLLAAIFASLLLGLGLGLVLKNGASSGGMDIPPIILSKKFNLPVAVLLYVIDTCILLLQVSFSNSEQVLYGILLVFLTSVVMSHVIQYGKNQVQVFIVSPKYSDINGAIHNTIDRGTTLVDIQTGYDRTEQKAVLSIVSNRQLAELNQLVLSIDPKAFMITNSAYEVKGRGFTLAKKGKY